MFRITEDPSSGSLVQCLAKNYKNDSIVSVDMDVVGVNGSILRPVVLVFSSQYMKALPYQEVPSYTGCFKKSFTTLKAYRNLCRGYTQRFELSKCSKTHRVLPRIVMVQCDFHW